MDNIGNMFLFVTYLFGILMLITIAVLYIIARKEYREHDKYFKQMSSKAYQKRKTL